MRLVEELLERQIRLHPLVREFSASLTPGEETAAFRQDCARRVAASLDIFAHIERAVQRDGADGFHHCLTMALSHDGPGLCIGVG